MKLLFFIIAALVIVTIASEAHQMPEELGDEVVAEVTDVNDVDDSDFTFQENMDEDMDIYQSKSTGESRLVCQGVGGRFTNTALQAPCDSKLGGVVGKKIKVSWKVTCNYAVSGTRAGERLVREVFPAALCAPCHDKLK
jgi:hypothetical protein